MRRDLRPRASHDLFPRVSQVHGFSGTSRRRILTLKKQIKCTGSGIRTLTNVSDEQRDRAIEFLIQQAPNQSERMDKMLLALEQDSEHTRALVRVAELRHERLMRLEGGDR
jgi:hypothetical protein